MQVRRIRTMQDVVDWRLCLGCGACYYLCDRQAVTLEDYESVGIRPRFNTDICGDCRECLSVCPGFNLEGRTKERECIDKSSLLGPALEIWEGFACDSKLHFSASSGGALSAIALYCLEKEGMDFVLHTGMNPSKPWKNITIKSSTREDLLANTGSRYAPSSPCCDLDLIEKNENPCVFIGKPCDVAAVSMLCRKKPELNRNIGLVLTFFCAGTPSTGATLELLRTLNVPLNRIADLQYRGNGWPGNFMATDVDGNALASMSYMDSWNKLQAHRPFRCHLCPDGLGETADISCGDAWHKYPSDSHKGLSLLLARSQKGRNILNKASESGYIELNKSSSGDVIKAQGLMERRKELYGRLLALKMMMIPCPRFENIPLYSLWSELPTEKKLRTIVGTMKRIFLRGLWHRNEWLKR